MTFGYGNSLMACDDDKKGVQDYLEVEDASTRNDSFSGAQRLSFCQSPGTTYYTARLIGDIAPPSCGNATVPPFVRQTDDGTTAEVQTECTEGTPCVDRDIYVITLASGAGGSISGRRLTVQLQAKSIGSFLEAEVFLFGNNEFEEPLATGSVPDAYALGDGDPVLTYDIPADMQTVFILVQPAPGDDGTYEASYGDSKAQNTYLARFIIEDPPTDE